MSGYCDDCGHTLCVCAEVTAELPERMEWLRQAEAHSTAIHDSWLDLLHALVHAVKDPDVSRLYVEHSKRKAEYELFTAAHPDGRTTR